MRKKKSHLFIIVAVICAMMAVFIVKQQMAGPGPADVESEGAQILLALRPIQYGELLVLQGQGDDPNVMLAARWPKDMMPEGVLTKAEDITESKVRAADSFVKHEPILGPKVIPDEQFKPEGMALERVGVDKDDITSGRLQPGMAVDVLQMVNNVPSSFMRNVRIYAVGSVDANQRPVKQEDPSPNVFLLIKKDDHLAFLKAKYTSEFLLVEAADPDGNGPVLVDSSANLDAQRADLERLMEEARGLRGAQEDEKAMALLQKAVERYPDLGERTTEALKQLAECRKKIANDYYEKARRAAEQDNDYALAMRHLDTIERDYADIGDVVRRAGDLRKTAQAALDERRAQTRYETILTNLAAAVQVGNLPQADELMAELKRLKDKNFQPKGDLQSPEAAIAQYEKQIRTAQQSYDGDKRILEVHLKQGHMEQARQKLSQIKQRFPGHPEISELEESVTAAAAAAGQ